MTQQPLFVSPPADPRRAAFVRREHDILSRFLEEARGPILAWTVQYTCDRCGFVARASSGIWDHVQTCRQDAT